MKCNFEEDSFVVVFFGVLRESLKETLVIGQVSWIRGSEADQ